MSCLINLCRQLSLIVFPLVVVTIASCSSAAAPTATPTAVPIHFNFVPIATSTATPPYRYDTAKATSMISSYVTGNIKPQFLTSTIDIKQGYQIDDTEDASRPNLFSAFIKNSAFTIGVSFVYMANTDTPEGVEAFVLPTNVKDSTATPSLAKTLTSEYFVNPYSPIMNCKSSTSGAAQTSCEEFKTEQVGKTGYGIVFANDQTMSPPSIVHIVFSCLFYKDGDLFSNPKVNSCLNTSP